MGSTLVEVRRDFLAVHGASAVMADAALLVLASATSALNSAETRMAWDSLESTAAGCSESVRVVFAESMAGVVSAESMAAGCSVSVAVVPSSAPTAASSHESADLVPAESVASVISAVSVVALGSLHRLEEHHS
jgi:hypothetical protein